MSPASLRRLAVLRVLPARAGLARERYVHFVRRHLCDVMASRNFHTAAALQ
jgi:hypothetical protein